MKKRYKLMTALSVAAVAAVLFAAIALAAGRMVAPRTDRIVAAQNGGIGGEDALNGPGNENETEGKIDGGRIDAKPTPEAEATPEITPQPTPETYNSEEDDAEWAENLPVTPEPTPTPTPIPQAMEQPHIVYTLPQGGFYHSVSDCSGMEGAVAWTEESARVMGKQPCPICIGAETENEAILEEENGDDPLPEVTNTPAPEPEAIDVPMYYTEDGTYYHGDAHCSGMVNAEPHTIELALASGKGRCPVCQPVEPDHYDLFVDAFGQGLEALVPGHAYSHSSGATPFFDSNNSYTWRVTDGEMELDACGVASFLRADGGDDHTTSGLGTALEDVMCFSFKPWALPDSDDLWRFLSRTTAGEMALREVDEAVEDAIEAQRLIAPVSVEEQEVEAYVDAAGRIVELDVYHVSTDGACSVVVGWTLTGDGYARKSRFDIYQRHRDACGGGADGRN